MNRIFLLLTVCLITKVVHGQDKDYLLKEFKEHKGVVNCVAFSQSGKYLASGGEDKALIIRNVLTDEPGYEHRDNYFPIKDIEFFGDDRLFVTAGADIKLIDLQNTKISVFKGNTTHIWSIDFAPERNMLTAGSYDSKIKVWDVGTQKIEFILEGHKKSTLPVAFSPDEKYIVSGSLDQSVKIWNAKTGELMNSMEKHSANIYDVCFHPNPKYFATASGDQSIRLWNLETGEVVKTYIGHNEAVVDIEFSPDGYFLYSASTDGTVLIWEVATGKKIHSFNLHEGQVNSVAASPDGNYVATAGVDGKVYLWKSAKIIVLEQKYGEEFTTELNKTGINEARKKGETKEQFEERQKASQQKYQELIDTYFARYITETELKNLPIL